MGEQILQAGVSLVGSLVVMGAFSHMSSAMSGQLGIKEAFMKAGENLKLFMETIALGANIY